MDLIPAALKQLRKELAKIDHVIAMLESMARRETERPAKIRKKGTQKK